MRCQAIPGSSFTPGTKETAKVETNKVMLIKTGLSEEPVCWFPKAFKRLFILVSLEAPGVQADALRKI